MTPQQELQKEELIGMIAKASREAEKFRESLFTSDRIILPPEDCQNRQTAGSVEDLLHVARNILEAMK